MFQLGQGLRGGEPIGLVASEPYGPHFLPPLGRPLAGLGLRLKCRLLRPFPPGLGDLFLPVAPFPLSWCLAFLCMGVALRLPWSRGDWGCGLPGRRIADLRGASFVKGLTPEMGTNESVVVWKSTRRSGMGVGGRRAGLGPGRLLPGLMLVAGAARGEGGATTIGTFGVRGVTPGGTSLAGLAAGLAGAP